eukprot:806902-Pleurochrysis_carterae.AAC.1
MACVNQVEAHLTWNFGCKRRATVGWEAHVRMQQANPLALDYYFMACYYHLTSIRHLPSYACSPSDSDAVSIPPLAVRAKLLVCTVFPSLRSLE